MMEKLLEAAKTMRTYAEKTAGVLGIRYHEDEESFFIHVTEDLFIENAREIDVDPQDVKVELEPNSEFKYRLTFHNDAVSFHSIATEKEYKDYFADWLEPPMDDEEFIQTPKGVTRQEVMMKEAGHKQSDFL